MKSFRGGRISKAVRCTSKYEIKIFPQRKPSFFWLTPLRGSVGENHSNSQGSLRQPLLPAEVVCGYIGVLPDLPESKTFCYFVKHKLVTKLLKKRYERYPDGQGEMCPLMKVRVLEWVDIF
jgi:hypothetical protein